MTNGPVTLTPGEPPPQAWYDASDQAPRGGEDPAATRLRITADIYGVDVSRVTSNDTVVMAQGITSTQPNTNKYSTGA